MTMQANTISSKGTRKNKKRVGRGNASQKGTYSGRGMKGQRSRSGGKKGLARRAFKAYLQKIPKLRGFKSMAIKKEVVTTASINRVFNDGDIVTPRSLNKKGLVDKPQHGVKIVLRGELSKPVTVKSCAVSKQAKQAIESAGGQIA